MSDQPLTALDRAWAAADAEGAGDAEVAHYYEVFAGAEVFTPIDPESLESPGPPQPLLFALETGDTALVFDSEDRLAAFMEDPGGVAHLTLSGRAVFEMFAGRGVSLGVNFGDAPSATLLAPDAVDWAAAALAQPVAAEEGRPGALRRPEGATPDLLTRLDARLSAMGDVVSEAWLCGRDQGLVLFVALRVADAERPVVAALAETARFAGGASPAFGVAPLEEDDPRLVAARKAGIGFEPAAPRRDRAGEDPSGPPKLR